LIFVLSSDFIQPFGLPAYFFFACGCTEPFKILPFPTHQWVLRQVPLQLRGFRSSFLMAESQVSIWMLRLCFSSASNAHLFLPMRAKI